MKFEKLLMILSLALAPNLAFAVNVTVDDSRCVDATISRAHEFITNYDNYSKLPGARFEKSVPGFGTMPMLTMVKSQSRFTAQTAAQTDALVWVVLQPTNVTDSKVYPRFLIHCTSAFDSAAHFTHACNLANEKQHFGLANFTSTLQVTANADDCAAGQSRLIYRLILESNAGEVTQIKKAATSLLGPIIGPIVAYFFNEETFFRSYYVNFYDSWAKAL